jgi:hypothetical protein
MARPSIEPVTDATLPEFAQFLHLNLMTSRSPAEWEAGLRTQWLPGLANYGFVVRDEGRIVGGIGAYYAQRQIRGQTERFCNITSWCVLDAYRQQSMRLAMALLGQKGFHFTNFSPTKVVGSSLKFMKFKELDERVAVVLNLPQFWQGGAKLLTRPADIEDALTGEALRTYKEHVRFPWLRHVVFGQPGRWCHVVYKRRSFKGLPAADILYVGDRAVFDQAFGRLATHFLGQGMVSTHVPMRCVDRAPTPSKMRSGFNPKLFLSETLGEKDIDCLYSETVALDL